MRCPSHVSFFKRLLTREVSLRMWVSKGMAVARNYNF
jgi:hypothetical protein